MSKILLIDSGRGKWQMLQKLSQSNYFSSLLRWPWVVFEIMRLKISLHKFAEGYNLLNTWLFVFDSVILSMALRILHERRIKSMAKTAVTPKKTITACMIIGYCVISKTFLGNKSHFAPGLTAKMLTEHG
jgi:hypothetical protein